MWKLHLIEDMERKVSVAENGTYYELIIATLEKFHKLMCLKSSEYPYVDLHRKLSVIEK